MKEIDRKRVEELIKYDKAQLSSIAWRLILSCNWAFRIEKEKLNDPRKIFT